MTARKLALPLGLVAAFLLGSFMTWVIMGGISTATFSKSAAPAPLPAPAKPAATGPKPAASAAPAASGQAAKPAPAQPVLLPQPKELSQVVDLLRTDFVDAPALMGAELDARKVADIFSAPAAQVRILAQDPPDGKNARILSELLPGKILYWSVPVFPKQEIDALAAQWEQVKAQGPVGLVFDLRETRAPQDFAGSADLAGLFAPPDTTLYSVQGLKIPQQVLRAQRQPLDFGSPFPIVVVVNSETRGAAEVLAQLLQSKAGAVLVGAPTAGEAAPNVDIRLKSGRLLRMATGRVLTASGQEVSKGPLVPDVEIAVNLEEDRKAMAVAAQSGVAGTVSELPLRKRLSEAALMSDENPEIDEILDEQKAKNAPKPKAVPHDATLHRAVDVLQGIRLSTQPPAPVIRK